MSLDLRVTLTVQHRHIYSLRSRVIGKYDVSVTVLNRKLLITRSSTGPVCIGIMRYIQHEHIETGLQRQTYKARILLCGDGLELQRNENEIRGWSE
jgi:hypothetical protein